MLQGLVEGEGTEDVKKEREKRETTQICSGEKSFLWLHSCAVKWVPFSFPSFFLSRRTSGVKQDTGRKAPSWQVDSLIPVTLNYVGNLHHAAQSRAESDSHMPRKPADIFFSPSFFSASTPSPPPASENHTDSCSERTFARAASPPTQREFIGADLSGENI